MAEKEKKETKGTRRYGHGPKIEPSEKGDKVGESGAPKGAAEEADKTAGKAEPHAAMDTDDGPSGTEDAGTEGIPVRHARERKEMVDRHESERHDTNKRHEKEHKGMMKRHAKEMNMPEAEDGEGGAEPEGEE